MSKSDIINDEEEYLEAVLEREKESTTRTGNGIEITHGGVFVFPVVSNPVFYLVSLIAGTVAAAITLAITKKKIA